MALPQGQYIKDVAETIDYIATVVLPDWLDSQPSTEAIDAMTSRLQRSIGQLSAVLGHVELVRTRRNAA